MSDKTYHRWGAAIVICFVIAIAIIFALETFQVGAFKDTP